MSLANVIIVEPSALLRLGIIQLLQEISPGGICEGIDYGQLFKADADPRRIDLMLLSIPTSLHRTIELIEAAQQSYCPNRILLLSDAPTLTFALDDLTGAELLAGHVSKAASTAILAAAVNLVMAGGSCFPNPGHAAYSPLPANAEDIPRRRWYEQAPSSLPSTPDDEVPQPSGSSAGNPVQGRNTPATWTAPLTASTAPTAGSATPTTGSKPTTASAKAGTAMPPMRPAASLASAPPTAERATPAETKAARMSLGTSTATKASANPPSAPVPAASAAENVTSPGAVPPGILDEDVVRHEADLLNLTPRQYEVLTLLARGYPIKTISRKLKIAISTAKTHTDTLYQRLSVHNGQAAVYEALTRGATLGLSQKPLNQISATQHAP